MESFAWCAIGAVLGLIAGTFATGPSKIARVEDILVGIFGSFVGAEFLVSIVWGTPHGLGLRGFAMAIGGAIAALMLLALMRRAVGPLKISKKRGRHHS